jgi:hypothetical protein
LSGRRGGRLLPYAALFVVADPADHSLPELGVLVDDLRGLFVEADPHDSTVRSDFERYWAPVDGRYELRSEAWAPPGLANDDDPARSLDEFRDWVSGTVLADPSTDHNQRISADLAPRRYALTKRQAQAACSGQSTRARRHLPAVWGKSGASGGPARSVDRLGCQVTSSVAGVRPAVGLRPVS